MNKLAGTAYHKIPPYLKTTLLSSQKIVDVWNDLTPLARNEWVCWVDSPKKKETRENHVKRIKKELLEGKRRPCCWPGCPHRTKKHS